MDSAISTPVTVAIYFQESSSGLGGSSTYQGVADYTDYYNQLAASATLGE